MLLLLKRSWPETQACLNAAHHGAWLQTQDTACGQHWGREAASLWARPHASLGSQALICGVCRFGNDHEELALSRWHTEVDSFKVRKGKSCTSCA